MGNGDGISVPSPRQDGAPVLLPMTRLAAPDQSLLRAVQDYNG
jgi:hypothetical protein